mgnify:CR=1 FL=1
MKTIKSKEMDMLNGGLVGKLILFSLPLAFSSILQQLFNSADVAVVADLPEIMRSLQSEAVWLWSASLST